MHCRRMPIRCGESLLKRDACCSTWPPCDSACPRGSSTVADGVIAVTADPTKRVTYGELIGGRRFNVALTGNNIDQTTGTAPLKPVQELKTVGKSPQRYDIPPKVDGSLKWAVDVRVPGMVHARHVRPPFVGATLTAVDESSVNGLPGFVRVVRKGNYLAVVFEREEQAIEGARRLRATWQKPATAPFPASTELFNYLRRATPTVSNPPQVAGDRRRRVRRCRQGGRGAITRCRSRGTWPSVRRTRWLIRRTIR